MRRGNGSNAQRFFISLAEEPPTYRASEGLSRHGRLGIVAEYNLFCPFCEDGLWDWCPLNARNNVKGVAPAGAALRELLLPAGS
jgi:hypothetical protein